MDQVRQIRVLIPAIMCIGALLLGARMDLDNSLRTLIKSAVQQNNSALTGIVGLLAAGSAFVLAGGVVIGGFTNLLLRITSWLLHRVIGENYCTRWETFLPKEFFPRVWSKLAPSRELPNAAAKYFFYAAVTFDHENLFKDAGGLHEWLIRRWNAFNVNMNSAVALLFASALAFPLGITDSILWFVGVTVVFVVLLINATFAWYETMRMLEFHSHRP